MIASPPVSPWTPPQVVTNEVLTWLGYVCYVALAVSILALITFGALLILDRDRGEPISATAPHIKMIQIFLGVLVISSAGVLAEAFA